MVSSHNGVMYYYGQDGRIIISSVLHCSIYRYCQELFVCIQYVSEKQRAVNLQRTTTSEMLGQGHSPSRITTWRLYDL